MIPLRDQEYIRQRFDAELQGRVKIDYFTQRPSSLYVPGREECAHCEDARKMLEEVSGLSDKVSLTVHEFAEAAEDAKKLGIDKVPGIVLRGPSNRRLRFFGMPGGNEFPNFIEAIVQASQQKVEADAEAAKHLKKLKDKISITVYVTPTCPHCPGVVRSAYRLALASAQIDAAAVEISEFPRLAQQLGVRAVPYTVINERTAIAGAIDEAALAEAALSEAALKGEGGASAPTTRAGAMTEAAQPGSAPEQRSPEGPPGGGLILPP